MPKYKICVYAISKNEEKFVNRWMDAVDEADMVVVLDTGSTDKTIDILRERGALVYSEKIEPWRFDTARNRAMSHIPDDVDICVSNDLDEVFEPGWREKLECAWDKRYTRAKYMFTWSYTPDGKPEKQFFMEKIHRRHGFSWVRPVHEILKYSGGDEDRTVFVNGMVLNHYPDNSKSRGQYLPLLELSVEEDPSDDRAMFWLGREYMYNAMYDKAIQTLKRHLEIPAAVWNEERSASMRYIARCLIGKESMDEALIWLYKAVAECPKVREPYLDIVKLGYAVDNWPLVYAMCKKALSIDNGSGSYLQEPECWGHALYDYAAIAAYRLSFIKDALFCAEEALKLCPGDERLRRNIELIKKTASVVSDDV